MITESRAIGISKNVHTSEFDLQNFYDSNGGFPTPASVYHWLVLFGNGDEFL